LKGIQTTYFSNKGIAYNSMLAQLQQNQTIWTSFIIIFGHKMFITKNIKNVQPLRLEMLEVDSNSVFH